MMIRNYQADSSSLPRSGALADDDSIHSFISSLFHHVSIFHMTHHMSVIMTSGVMHQLSLSLLLVHDTTGMTELY